jgi:hypothetical protein
VQSRRVHGCGTPPLQRIAEDDRGGGDRQARLPDGIALQIATERVTLANLAEWISFERKCCPFFDFRIDVAREGGPVWLSLSGRPGVKEFLTQVFAS